MPRLTAIVLGSAAGGGFPQWNCRCPVCALAWDADPRVQERTQTSVAVSADGKRWTLLNASPDLREQIARTNELQPHFSRRESPIEAVLLTGGEIDQVAGLLHLREAQAFSIFATAETQSTLQASPLFDALSPNFVTRSTVALHETFSLPGGMQAELFPVPGKVPLYLEGESEMQTGMNVGVEISAGDARILFVPGAASVPSEVLERMQRANAVLFDGTLFTDDEMIRLGVSEKTGLRMGHMPVSGEGGSLDALASVSARRIYIHINNTNPLLIDDSVERRAVTAQGFEVAYDGMEIVL